jgi:UDP-N-acetylglucosamine--N-acetylmuramyl-(pentapeptide) pyrophosphoryl-undecaprenol N-acetylglucosamine transferase
MQGATFLIAAGGTGGHVLPGIEVARELRARGHLCVFVGTNRGQEKRLVPAAGFALELLQAGALKGLSVLKRLKTLVGLPASFLQARAVIEKWHPEAVLSLGGYASGPTMVMARMKEIPVVVLEPNARPGLAVRWAAPFVERGLVAFPEALTYFGNGRAELSGIPIRREFFELARRETREPFTLLITGGSQGARRLNTAVVEALGLWDEKGRLSELKIVHQTGVGEYERVREAYAKYTVDAEVAPFFDDMPSLFAAADLVICRAGASAVAELCAAGKASILVPYPYAADQHQRLNARSQAEIGAARVVEDHEMSGERLLREVEVLWSKPAELARMENAARGRAKPSAASRAALLLEALAGASGEA